jgi:sugar O-acyltransferase (sialic acid O-acetyltransferase NeuD family)
MNRKLIIFGSGDLAELAHFYFVEDSDYEVVAFTLDGDYIKESMSCGLPVVAFENVFEEYSPTDYDCFVALSYSKINSLRMEKYLEAKDLGYSMANYISSRATILNQGRIGENCLILEDNTIQPFVRIGNNVTLWSGNHIGHHSVIRDHAFISSHVVISGGVEIGEQCFVGVNATLRDHIKVGAKSVIGAGTLILSDVARDGVYIGSSTERSKVPSSRLRGI